MKIIKHELDRATYTTGYQDPGTGNFIPSEEDSFNAWNQQKGWHKFGPLGNNLVFTQGDLDLAGLTIDNQSIFFENIVLQEPVPIVVSDRGVSGDGGGPYDESGPVVGAAIIVNDLVTTVPLDTTNVNMMTAAAAGYAGFRTISRMTFEHVVYNRTRIFALDLDFGSSVAQLTSSTQTGSGMPTASDKLYIYRFVSWDNKLKNANVTIPPSRIVFGITSKKEHDVEYLFRLKRSYELQQTFDRD